MRRHSRVIPSAARDLHFNPRQIALCMIFLVTVFSLAAKAQGPVPLARGNTPGEPHHHLKIENEYVRVYYVEVPPHENTQLHQHDHDYIYVSLGPADVVNAIVNKPEIHLQLKDGETHFTRGGFAHIARNLADTPFRNITVELLKPQGNARNLCEEVIIGAPLNDCQSSTGNLAASPLAFLKAAGPKRLFETEQVFVSSHFAPVQQNYGESGPQAARLLVMGDRSELRVDFAGRESKSLSSGEMLWLEAGMKWTIVTPAEHKVTRFLLLRFNEARNL